MTERWRIGDRIQDRYEVHDIKGGPGKSGMGIVYICYDHESKVPLAVKTFQEGLLSSKKARDDFTKEALTWVKLDRHKNIVRAHYVDVIEGRPYIFLEYVAGGSLDDWIGTKMLILPLALKFAVEFCNGMEFAHKKLGLVHRDVKPGNILITPDKTVKVTDFGLAKAVEVEGPESPAVPSHDATFLQSRPAGTCCWMAPEQWTGKEIDTRADIYAFGIVLYQMITEGYPYPLHSNWFRIRPEEWQTVHLKGSSQPITQDIPRELNGLVFKCLEKEPARRYQNFSELKEELLEIYYSITGKRIVLEETPEALEIGDLINKGVAMINLGRHLEAIDCYDKALEINPRDADAWNNKGVALAKRGKYQEAIVCFDKTLEINPRDVEAWNNKGVALGKLGKYQEAIDCYDKALEINPGYGDAWVNKGNVLRNQGRPHDALAYYDKALKINPRDTGAWNNKGFALGKLGRHQEAIDCCDKALEINPREAEAWINKGAALRNRGKYQEAINSFQKFIEFAPPQYAALVKGAEGNIRQLKRTIQGETHTEKVIEGVTPQKLEAGELVNKGIALGSQGRYREAIACFDKALEINPRYAEVWINKGIVLGKLGRYQEAIACYDNALEINPKYAEAWYNKGVALANLERYQEAIACYDKSLEIIPRHADAWNNKGAALANQGIHQEAIDCCDKALEINPRHAGAWNNKGAALVSLRRYQEAIETFQKFIEFAPPQYAAHVKGAEGIIRQLRNKIREV